jgi:hypothetical protein
VFECQQPFLFLDGFYFFFVLSDFIVEFAVFFGFVLDGDAQFLDAALVLFDGVFEGFGDHAVGHVVGVAVALGALSAALGGLGCYCCQFLVGETQLVC